MHRDDSFCRADYKMLIILHSDLWFCVNVGNKFLDETDHNYFMDCALFFNHAKC